MKIIIAGAGEVGTHLAKLLSAENQEILLIDMNEERLYNAESGVEIMTQRGNPISIKDLEEAGVGNADMFIAVTPEETTNITASILASNLGAQRTFARINNYEYMLAKNKVFFEKMGVNTLIYPELLAAKEVRSAMRHPWVRQYWEFFGGTLLMLGVKVRENAPIVGKALSDPSYADRKFHVVAIKRNNDTIIPSGHDVIQAEDIVFFTCARSHMDNIRELAGKKPLEVKRAFIMGGSRIAMRVSQFLSDYNIQVTIFEQDRDRCRELAGLVSNNTLVIHGDARDSELLKSEHIETTQAFIALTGNSSTNILACLAAKRLGVRKTVAQIENIDYISLSEKFDIGTVINKKLIAAGHIYQYLLDTDMHNMKCLTIANADVAEIVVREGSQVTKQPVKSLHLPKDVTLGGLIRQGEPTIISGDTQIMAGDRLVVFCLDTALRKVEKYFS